MNIIERVKNILVKPKEEWQVINAETTSSNTLLTTYVIPLALLAAIACIVGLSVIDSAPFKFGIFAALIMLVSMVVAVLGATYITDELAPSFGSEKNLNKSAQLVMYSCTPALLGGLLSIIPDIAWLGLLLGSVYSLYLLFLGLPVLKKTPEDKVPIYLIIIILVTGLIFWLVKYILTRIFSRMMVRYYIGL